MDGQASTIDLLSSAEIETELAKLTTKLEVIKTDYREIDIVLSRRARMDNDPNPEGTKDLERRLKHLDEEWTETENQIRLLSSKRKSSRNTSGDNSLEAQAAAIMGAPAERETELAKLKQELRLINAEYTEKSNRLNTRPGMDPDPEWANLIDEQLRLLDRQRIEIEGKIELLESQGDSSPDISKGDSLEAQTEKVSNLEPKSGPTSEIKSESSLDQPRFHPIEAVTFDKPIDQNESPDIILTGEENLPVSSQVQSENSEKVKILGENTPEALNAQLRDFLRYYSEFRDRIQNNEKKILSEVRQYEEIIKKLESDLANTNLGIEDVEKALNDLLEDRRGGESIQSEDKAALMPKSQIKSEISDSSIEKFDEFRKFFLNYTKENRPRIENLKKEIRKNNEQIDNLNLSLKQIEQERQEFRDMLKGLLNEIRENKS
ncbi:MAG: hypothetical protein WCO23_02285 [bacterium]